MRITGDSAAGKSELARTLLDAQNPRAGITVTCRYPCAVLDDQAFRAASREILKLSGRIKNHDSAEFYHAARRLLADYACFLSMKIFPFWAAGNLPYSASIRIPFLY